jgi:arylsulfatase A
MSDRSGIRTRARRVMLGTLAVVAVASVASVARGGGAQRPATSPLPNIVVILTDDQGYGDVSAFNPASRIPTPHIDRLAREGMRFTDAHSSSSVCTPTRYGLLTGRYAWRTRLKKGVLWSNGDTLIEPGRTTLATMLRERGYYTAAVGKWHLGLHWTARAAATVDRETLNGPTEWIDYTGPVTGGPIAAGFDEFFGIPASLDMRDYVYVENERVVEAPTARLPGIAEGLPGFYRRGVAGPSFRVEGVLDDLTTRAVNVVKRRSGGTQPFFLYLALAAPHTPMLPTGSFVGKTALGPYGDFVAQTDAAIGAVLTAIEAQDEARRTVVILASDNGPAPIAGIADLLKRGHDAAGGWRGAKHGLYEGGHRVPFVVRWPGVTRAGTTSARTIVLTDVIRTLADGLGGNLSRGAAEDSVSFYPVLRDAGYDGPLHEAIVMHSAEGEFAIRQGRWKLILAPEPRDPVRHGSAVAAAASVQLYDLDADPKETRTLESTEPEIVTRLRDLLEEYRRTGRSR